MGTLQFYIPGFKNDPSYPKQKELFQVSLAGFQKFFLFWIAWIILEAWDAELVSAHSFMFHFVSCQCWCTLNSVFELLQ